MMNKENMHRNEEESGAQLVASLKEVWKSSNQEKILSVLKTIGDRLHARWGYDMPTLSIYDALENAYKVFLSTGTSGTRLFIHTKENDPFPGDLVFPNVNLDHKVKGRTLADVFEEVFGELAENIQDKEQPYYVVKVASA